MNSVTPSCGYGVTGRMSVSVAIASPTSGRPAGEHRPRDQ